MSLDLGGFAQYPSDIEATEEEFYAFNFCLAEEYFSSMYAEDFELIGEMDTSLIRNIIHYLNYGGTFNDEEIKKIETGLFLTYKNRTFVDAIVENKITSLADTYISLGNNDPRLYVIVMLYDEYYTGVTILNNINYHVKNKDEYVLMLCKIFNEIDKLYNNIKDKEEKIILLKKIKNNLKLIRYPQEYGKVKISDIGNYNFFKELKYII